MEYQLVFHKTVLIDYLNYVERLALSMCSRALRIYKPNAEEEVRRAFLRKGIEPIDVTNTNSYIAGGFLVKVVFDGQWTDGDCDIYSTSKATLYRPLFPIKHNSLSEFRYDLVDSGIQKIGEYAVGWYNSYSRVHTDPISLISTKLYDHPNLIFVKYHDNNPYYKDIINLQSEGDYVFLRHINFIRNFKFTTTSERCFDYCFPRNRKMSLLKNFFMIQEIVVKENYKIEDVVAHFDLNICRLYFDGKSIKFYRLDDFFRRNYTQYEIAFKSATDRYGFDFKNQISLEPMINKTISRVYKYIKRFNEIEERRNTKDNSWVVAPLPQNYNDLTEQNQQLVNKLRKKYIEIFYNKKLVQ